MLLSMTREEKAFVIACIQEKTKQEKEQEKKMKANRPRKR